MRVMTWNLLTDSRVAARPWPDRCPSIAATVAALAPTVLGTQEASAAMLDDLVSALPPGYRWIGEGRRGTLTDETCAVVYDSSAVTVLDVRHRWLSATPDVPGSSAPDAELPRMLTAARFHDRGSGVALTVVNTHLDHVGRRARLDGAASVAGQSRSGPTVVMGDFNDVAESPAYATLVGAGLRDALAPRDRPARRLRTFVGLDQELPGEGEQIDWVFVTPDIDVQDAWVERGSAAGATASDHRAVVADLRLA